jgi:hypothetical protein
MTKKREEIIKQHCFAIFSVCTGKKTWSRPGRFKVRGCSLLML